MQYGFSFGSKKVASGPTFFNLRIMCECLGRAMRRHIDFSQSEFWFLDEKHEAKKIYRKEQLGVDLEESVTTV
jgi:hypothetical protein